MSVDMQHEEVDNPKTLLMYSMLLEMHNNTNTSSDRMEDTIRSMMNVRFPNVDKTIIEEAVRDELISSKSIASEFKEAPSEFQNHQSWNRSPFMSRHNPEGFKENEYQEENDKGCKVATYAKILALVEGYNTLYIGTGAESIAEKVTQLLQDRTKHGIEYTLLSRSHLQEMFAKWLRNLEKFYLDEEAEKWGNIESNNSDITRQMQNLHDACNTMEDMSYATLTVCVCSFGDVIAGMQCILDRYNPDEQHGGDDMRLRTPKDWQNDAIKKRIHGVGLQSQHFKTGLGTNGERQLMALADKRVTGKTETSNIWMCNRRHCFRYAFTMREKKKVLYREDDTTLSRHAIMLAPENGAPLLLGLAFGEATLVNTTLKCFLRKHNLTTPKKLADYLKDMTSYIDNDLSANYTGTDLQKRRRTLIKDVCTMARDGGIDETGNFDLGPVVQMTKPKAAAPRDRSGRDQTGRRRWPVEVVLAEAFINDNVGEGLAGVFGLSAARQALLWRFTQQLHIILQEICGNALRMVDNDTTTTKLAMRPDIIGEAETVRRNSLSAYCMRFAKNKDKDKRRVCNPDEMTECCARCKDALRHDEHAAHAYANVVDNVNGLVDPLTEEILKMDSPPILKIMNTDSDIDITFTENILRVVRLADKLFCFANLTAHSIYNMVPFHDLTKDVVNKIIARGEKWFQCGVFGSMRTTEEMLGEALNMHLTETEKAQEDADEDESPMRCEEPNIRIEQTLNVPLSFLLQTLKNGKKSHDQLRREVSSMFLKDTGAMELSGKEKKECRTQNGAIRVVKEKMKEHMQAPNVIALLTDMADLTRTRKHVLFNEETDQYQEDIIAAKRRITPDEMEFQLENLRDMLVDKIANCLRDMLKGDQLILQFLVGGSTQDGGGCCRGKDMGNIHVAFNNFPFVGRVLLPKPQRLRRNNKCKSTLRWHMVIEVLLTRVVMMQMALVNDVQGMLSVFVTENTKLFWNEIMQKCEIGMVPSLDSETIKHKSGEDATTGKTYAAEQNMTCKVINETLYIVHEGQWRYWRDVEAAKEQSNATPSDNQKDMPVKAAYDGQFIQVSNDYVADIEIPMNGV
jgi:hypothetical protein